MPLPVLREGIFDSFKHYLAIKKKPGAIDALIDELGKKDQLLLLFINGLAAAIDDLNEEIMAPQAAIFSALMVYKILESQQNADDLKNQIG